MEIEQQVQVQEQQAVAENTAPQTDTQVSGETVTPEQNVAESDEQRNERVLSEAREKAEKRASGVQRRIDELTADKYAERKRAEELARQNELLLQQLKGSRPSEAKQDDQGPPKREQFQDDWSFINANTEYIAQQKAMEAVRQASETARQNMLRQQAEQQQARLDYEFTSRQKDFIKTAPDYLEVVQSSDFPVPGNVLQLIKALPDGPAVTYHMAKNPDIAKQFFSTPPELHGFILGQISATLKSTPRVSNAPAPGKTVGAKGGTSTEPPSDPEQYYAWAQKNLR